MASEDVATHDDAAEQSAGVTSTPDSTPLTDSAQTPRPEPTLDVDRTPDPGGAADAAPTTQPEPTQDVDNTDNSDPSREHGSKAPGRWFEDETGPFQRRVLAFDIPLVLLLVITAIVVAIGSGLLLLGASELVIGPIVIAWPVATAALAVLVIGFSALWLASRQTASPSDH
jgi:hypothetical protein